MRSRQIGEKNFDERQVQIRGQVFQHAFLAAIVLLFANSMLQAFGVEWANGYMQNTTMACVAMSIFVIEALLRGVLFGKQENAWMPVLTFAIMGLMWSANSLNFAHMEIPTTFSKTDIYVSYALAALFFLLAIAGTWAYVAQRRNRT
ncbi:MAG: hypothetical protein FWD55_07520 [Propionibacteriaceae bacterium]|nr:hypothetical protein [Propionibacteriaceae bacterium]